MPITIPILPPGERLSPGQLLAWNSSAFGPFPTGTSLTVAVSRDSEGSEVIGFGVIQNVQGNGQFNLYAQTSTSSWSAGQFATAEGATVFLQMQLHEPGVSTPIDSGTVQLVWAPDSNVSLLPQTTGGTSSGLTPVQAQQVEETHESVFPEFLIDQLTLQPLASVPTSGPVNAFLTSPIFGVIVRIANVPENLVPNTPDGDYWVPSLAVVRIFRGSDLWLRVPVHTSSKLINLWLEGLSLGLADIVLSAGWLLNLSIQVTFREGVTGTVFLMRVP